MRYSIQNVTRQEVEASNGLDIKEAPGTGIIFAELSEAGVASLQSLGAKVKKVDKVKLADIAPPIPIPVEKGLSASDLLGALGFTEEWRHLIIPPLYGEGFGIAIIDSGIRETHELIKGRVVYSKNFTTSPSGDNFNHGTGVASIVTTLAPQCDVIDIKVIGDDGLGTDETVVMGISEVISLREAQGELFPHVINLSLGKEDDGDPDDPIRVVCRIALDKEIFVVAACGNLGPDMGTILSPACEKYVGAVGSITYNPESPQESFLVSEFSSRGPTKEGLIKPDVVLPGEGILMADSKSDTATIAKSGTSFAVALGSSAILLQGEGASRVAYLREPYRFGGKTIPITPIELMDVWIPLLTIKPAGNPRDKDVNYGWGIPYGELAELALTGRPYSTMNVFNSIAEAGMMIMMMGVLIKQISK